MKTYKLNAEEIDMVVDALLYATNYGYPLKDEGMRALIDRLNPKPVQKHGWMVIYADGTKRGLFDSEIEAEGWVIQSADKIVKVHWEE